ncbi:MAG: tetratricopeptide repeat protein [Promethearchaeota archaeon]|jgi:tetratricopeptide (TPR) repeat protein
MAYLIVEELKRGFELLNEGKVEEALQLITIFEKKEDLTLEDKLKCQILKGILFYHLGRIDEALKIGEVAYQESLRLEKPLLSIDAIIAKYRALRNTGRRYNSELWEFITYTEDVLKSTLKETPSEIEQREAFLNNMKGELYFREYELDHALDSLQKSLVILERYNQWSYLLPNILANIGLVYSGKGELDLALKYYRKCLKTSKGNNVEVNLTKAASIREIGRIYFQKGDFDQALKYYEKSLKIYEKIKSPRSKYNMCVDYNALVRVYLAKNSPDLAQEYLTHLQDLVEKHSLYFGIYRIAKALILKSSNRTRDRAEAEKILKESIEKHMTIKVTVDRGMAEEHTPALIELCDLYLEELRTTHNLEIISDIQPYLTRLVKESERTNSFSLQAQSYLFQGQIAFLQMNLGDARRFLTKAQQVADDHGLQLLARSISSEHDKLLEQLDEWENFKGQKTPLSEILKLVSLNETMEHMQGKRALKKKELGKENPMLLLIMNEGGVLVFSYPFNDEWERDNELLGSFMSAFTSFSDEFFSEELDRVKFGQYTVLMKAIPNFSVCYVFKGQSYLAKQKLTHFTNRIQNNQSIIKTLDNFYQKSQVIEIKDFPFLEVFITEIFTPNDQISENI